MSARQEIGSPIRKTEPCSRRRYRQTRPEGRSPPPRGCLRSGYALPSTPPQRHSHPDCRAILTLIVALDSHAFVDPTKIRGVERSRVHQGKERDPSGADLRRTKAQFRGAKLLGARLFREHGWTRRKGDPRVHPEPREGRPTARATQPLEVTATFRWPVFAEPR